ncbi:hypothetical protein ABPG75_007803 [Micractinium tetrahymenae]
MADLPPGDGERLQSAAALPQAERDADVQAFIDAVRLEREACKSLPLPPPPPKAAAGADSRRREVLAAFCKVLRADYLCPQHPPTRPVTNRHLMAYVRGLWDGEPADEDAQAAAAGSRGSKQAGGRQRGGQKKPPPAARTEVEAARGQPLPRVLQLYCCAAPIGGAEAVQACRDATDILADPVAAPRVAAALKDLEAWEALGAPAGAPPALLTPEQLAHACHCQTVKLALRALSPAAAQQLPAARRSDVLAAAAHAADALLALEPANPKSWELAGAAASMDASLPRQLALDRAVRAAQLARDQGRPYWVALCGDSALTAALSPLPGVHDRSVKPESVAAVVEAYERAAPALQRCQRVLPQIWVHMLERALAASAPMLPVVRAQMAERAAGGAGTSSPAEAEAVLEAVQRARQAQQAQQQAPRVAQLTSGGSEAALRCAACKQHAENLMRCGRCRAAQYCSVECQRKDWAAHKKACKPAT